MPGYFSFQKCITSAFVKAIYFIGFLALTAGGIGFAAWAAMGLYRATMPRELGWYYVAIGVGILFVGNLVWRVFCEIWIVPFNIHTRLVSLDQKMEPMLSQPMLFQPMCARCRQSNRARSDTASSRGGIPWDDQGVCSDCRDSL